MLPLGNRSVWISGVYLGTRGCKVASLLSFIQNTETVLGVSNSLTPLFLSKEFLQTPVKRLSSEILHLNLI